MDRKIIPWVIVFGLIMIAIGHYRRMLAWEEMNATGVGDPLVQAIMDHNEKESESLGLTNFTKQRKDSNLGQTLRSAFGGHSDEEGDDAEAPPEDGFLIHEGDDSRAGKYRKLNLDGRSRMGYVEPTPEPTPTPTPRSRLDDIKDPLPVDQRYYPPALMQADPGATQEGPAQKNYYPPAPPVPNN